MNRKEAESNIINFSLAAFADCKAFEPTTQSLTMRVWWDEDDRIFRLNAYNDAYRYEDCKPLEIHGHFTEIADVTECIGQAKKANINVQPIAQPCKTVTTDFPNLYSAEEILDIFDEAVLRMVAGLEKEQLVAKKEITVTKLCLGAFKEQLRHDLREAEIHE